MTYNNKLAWTLVKQLFGKTLVVSVLLYRHFLQKVCGKFHFLSNNCSAKQVYFSILLYKQYASESLWKVWILIKQLYVKKDVLLNLIVQEISSKSLWKVCILVKQLFGKKGVLLHPIVQAICFKKPVECLNYCQTIVRQKKLIFPYYCTGIEQTIFKKNWLW
jgi:hypothetical protein